LIFILYNKIGLSNMTTSDPPLAERMRPKKLLDLLGQEHLTGPGCVLQKAILNQEIPSMILWGPPGVGKTTVALLIEISLKRPFYILSAISSGVKEVRDIIEKAKNLKGAILFIDEIHRFNKGQQDALLGAVEKGIITLIGATTENPSFEIISALLSRCQVFLLKPLEDRHLLQLLNSALQTDQWLRDKQVSVSQTGALLRLSGGDARKFLNIIELSASVISENENLVITDESVMNITQQRISLYDKAGDQHYDIISAFIKSIRGSDPNGAVYWLARMISGGEDVKFIARRMLILASEDIGNSNPTALVIANNTFQAVHIIGYPEARIILSQCAIYLACSSKSNSSYKAINEAQALTLEKGDLPVPLHLRNAPTKLMESEGYGKGYKYSHNYYDNFSFQEYLPEALSGTQFYFPGDNSRELEFRRVLRNLWKDKYEY